MVKKPQTPNSINLEDLLANWPVANNSANSVWHISNYWWAFPTVCSDQYPHRTLHVCHIECHQQLGPFSMLFRTSLWWLCILTTHSLYWSRWKQSHGSTCRAVEKDEISRSLPEQGQLLVHSTLSWIFGLQDQIMPTVSTHYSFEMKFDPLKRLTKQRARLSSRPTLNTLCTMAIFSLICLLSYVPSTGCWDRMPLTSAKGSGSLWPKTSTLFWLSSYFLLNTCWMQLQWWLMKLQLRVGETHC